MVPCVAIVPFKSFCLLEIEFLIAVFNSSPLKSLKSLSAKYLSFNSLGVPIKPLVKNGETTGSANSQICPFGSLNAPSPYTITSTCELVNFKISSWIPSTKPWASRGNNLIFSSVDLLDPSNPYFSL